ncbi:MAG: metal-dependent hydrolase [Alkalibacterium sp.]|uniref:metal-dependent hydrolase n=1 Tax=Alkalibacterium sp. TaxID=1872447 RepID=UPI0039706C33
MLYKSHVIVTYAAVLPILVSTDSLTIGNVIALGIGSLLPDIDHPKSFIGNRTRGVSDGISMVFGHRGLLHSIVGVIFFLLASQFILSSFQQPLEWAYWFTAGYIAHLVEDSFSKTGVAWLQPVYNKRIQFGFKLIYYKTGKMSETVLFLAACAGLFYQLVLLTT